jgi:predicted lactoylglutathione lyase
MKPQLNFINLAVYDLERSIAFYRDGLGLPTQGIVGSEFHDELTGADGTIAFFNLRGGLLLGLYERSNLAKDASIALDPQSSTEFSLGYAVKSEEEVDELINKAIAAGASVAQKPRSRPWGVYSGYFKDLDGHLWEITWDPRITTGD